MARFVISGMLVLGLGFVSPVAAETVSELAKPSLLVNTLKNISERYGFDIEGLQYVTDEPTKLSSSNTKDRLRYLLKAYNYVIIESPNGRVKRVLIFGRIANHSVSSNKDLIGIAPALPSQDSEVKCPNRDDDWLLGTVLPASHKVSSNYGMRRHPILGYLEMHRGVDFAAPTGTPVYAAINGVVLEKGKDHSYGNFVRLQHASQIETVYAHLSRFASRLEPGTQVTKGKVIGYVGSTGLATGSHLHYEVILDGKRVDPNGVGLPLCARFAKSSAY